MRKSLPILIVLLSMIATSLYANPRSQLESEIELNRRLNNVSLQADEMQALDELNNALSRLDSRLERRVQAIESARIKREQEEARILEIMLNIERHECEDESYFPEFDEICELENDDIYQTCEQKFENTSLAR